MLTRWGRRPAGSGSPCNLRVGHAGGDHRGADAGLKSCSRAASAANLGAVRATSAAAVATAPGTSSGPRRAVAAVVLGPGRAQRVPSRTISRPTPDGPPNLCRARGDAGRQPHVPRVDGHPADAIGRRRRASGHSGAWQRSAISATGWRGADLLVGGLDADQRRLRCPAAQCGHRHPSGGSTGSWVTAAACAACTAAGEQHAGVLDRRDDQRGLRWAAMRPPACREMASWAAAVPLLVKLTSGGRDAERGGRGLARRVVEQARLAAFPMQSGGVGPACVVGGQQGLAGGRMQRRPGGPVQIRGARLHPTKRRRAGTA